MPTRARRGARRSAASRCSWPRRKSSSRSGRARRRRPACSSKPQDRWPVMKQTTYEEFVDLSRRGTFVPVVKEIIADLLTPVSAFLKIAEHSDYAFLFESVEGGERVARYSFLGKDPFLVLQARAGEDVHRSLRRADRDRRALHHGRAPDDGRVPGAVRPRPAAVHRRRRRLHRLRRVARLRAGAEQAWQHASWASGPAEDDAGFMLFDTVLVFDHVKHRILIIANARITADEDLDALYQFACAKIQFLERELERSLSQRQAAGNGAPDVRSNQTREHFETGVRTIKERIAAGDIYQAVLSQRFEADITADPFTVYRALRHVNPSPYMYFIRLGGLSIVGSSPEMLVRVEGRRVETHPIAGTRPRGCQRGRGPAARRGAEAQREGARRARDAGGPGPQRSRARLRVRDRARRAAVMALERYSHVMHLVSTVEGRSPTISDHLDALVACFPAGTVSGAPKIRAMQIIDELEPTRRDVYAGAVGYIDFAGNLDFCIAIRTITIRDGRAGPGRRRHRRRLEPGRRVRGDARQGARAAQALADGGGGPVILLLIDNYDSFTYNLAQYLGELGAPPVRSAATTRSRSTRSTALRPDAHRDLAGAGPPEDAGVTVDVIRRFGPRARARRLPRAPGHRRRVRRRGRARAAADARQDVVRPARRRGVFPGVPQPFEPAATTRWSSREPLPDVSRLPRAPTTARSWACATASARSTACSSTPSRSSPGEGPSGAAELPGVARCSSALLEKLLRAARTSTVDEAAAAMDEIMDGRGAAGADRRPARRAGDEGERPAEIVGFARTMRARATRPSHGRARCSTPAAPAATARTRSTSPPSPRWWWPRAACAGRQARQPLGVEPLRQRRSVRGARRQRRRADPPVVERCSTRRASPSSSRRPSTRRCGTRRRRGASSACARCSTCSAR